jgi:hypothetical protein
MNASMYRSSLNTARISSVPNAPANSTPSV